MSSVANAFAYDKIQQKYKGSLGKYYDVPSYDDFKKGKQPTLKAGYMSSSARMAGEGVGEMVYSKKPERVIERRGKSGQHKYRMTAPLNIYKAPAPAPAAAAAPAPAAPAPLMPQISAASQQYRAETQALSDKIAKQQADFNASQAAATKAREIAEQARITGIRTAASNQARSGQAPNLQIQPASKTEAKGGTSLFKKRSQDQFMTGISGMVNI